MGCSRNFQQAQTCNNKTMSKEIEQYLKCPFLLSRNDRDGTNSQNNNRQEAQSTEHASLSLENSRQIRKWGDNLLWITQQAARELLMGLPSSIPALTSCWKTSYKKPGVAQMEPAPQRPHTIFVFNLKKALPFPQSSNASLSFWDSRESPNVQSRENLFRKPQQRTWQKELAL